MNRVIPLFVTLSTFVGDSAKRIQKRYVGDDRGASIVEYIALLFIVALIVAAVYGSGIDQTIKAKAVSIWLRCDIDILVRRVGRKDTRPLLSGKDPKEVLTELAQKRYPTYAEADIMVETGDAAHHVSVDQIIQALSAHLQGQTP